MDAKQKKYGKDYYSMIAKRSWSNPERNRKVGFATMPIEKVKELGAKGGKSKKANADEEPGEESVADLQPVDKG